jgi:hypothetical protein
MIVEFTRSAKTCAVTYVVGDPVVSIVQVLSRRADPNEIQVRSQTNPIWRGGGKGVAMEKVTLVQGVFRVLPLSSQHHSTIGSLITVQLPPAVYNISN